jgi:putative oxidoreductase
MARKPLSPPDAARRRFLILQSVILIAFGAVVAASGILMPRLADTPLRWLLAAGPLALLVWWGWQFYKMVRDDDEMMHVLHLRAVAISAMLVLLGGTMWGVLERLLDAPVLPAYLLLPLFAVPYSVAVAVLARRA